MCGICGIWNKPRATSEVQAMIDRMHHRGPDESGVLENRYGSLGHARLSIMDPQGGRQPIYNETGSLAVVANGEIYNFPQLHEELRERHTFRTGNDSEILVHLYEEHGPEMVRYLDGMYAFCIADGEKLFLARDPIGIKPLYYAWNEDGTFLFTSELKACVDGRRFRLREFPPGTVYETDKGFSTYYTVPVIETDDFSAEEQAGRLREVLERSVYKRLMSDVPLGTFLSGGLDSSIISALTAARIKGLHTFSVGLRGSGDLPAARAVAAHIGSRHHEHVIEEDEVLEVLPAVIAQLESFDQDLVRSAVPCYFTSRLAARHVKVILTGEGADELFGGYAYYKEIKDKQALHRELIRSVSSLHNINLQRVDRMTMAHSIEGRVPFLDLQMIEVGQKIQVSLKLVGEPPMEKWILRKACEDLLPEEIVWRTKAQFDEGTGFADALPRLVGAVFSDEAYAEVKRENPEVYLRSREEAYYFKVFSGFYSNQPHVVRNVARWSQRPV